MTAHDLICDFHRRGIRLELSAGARVVRWTAPGPLEMSQRDVDALRALKADVVDLLLAIEERAAIIELEGGMERDAAELAAFDEFAKPVDFSGISR